MSQRMVRGCPVHRRRMVTRHRQAGTCQSRGVGPGQRRMGLSVGWGEARGRTSWGRGGGWEGGWGGAARVRLGAQGASPITRSTTDPMMVHVCRSRIRKYSAIMVGKGAVDLMI